MAVMVTIPSRVRRGETDTPNDGAFVEAHALPGPPGVGRFRRRTPVVFFSLFFRSLSRRRGTKTRRRGSGLRNAPDAVHQTHTGTAITRRRRLLLLLSV